MAADVNELISKIDKLIDRLDSRTASRQTTRDGDDYFTAQEKNRKKYDEIRKDYETAEDLANVEKEYNEQRKKIAQKYADEILSNLDKHNKSKIALLNEEKEKELEILKAAGKDTTELEKEYAEKRKEILKSSLVEGNQTVFEELNERFQKEYELYKEAGEDTYEIEKAYNKKRRELAVKQVGQIYSAIKNIVRAGEEQINDIAETWGVTNQAAHDYGKTVGLTANKIEKLHAATIGWMSDNNISKQFNIGADEMFKIMGSYNKELNRAVALTNETKLNLVSMRNVMGDEQAIKFTANLDKFGLDVDASKELVQSIVGDARRSGIVLSNLTQNVADNLYLAQQYTFEDGIEGLVRMAEKAAAVKWNMQQTAAFAEKVNNVEGAIKTGAQLSVLGGPFAQFSNPMGMLYESLNDMEGLQDRVFAMFGRLGQWNKEKGMLDISAFDKQRIRAASSAMGLNYSDVINNVQSQARRNVVESQIKNLGLDSETTELIKNTAQIDRETGKAYVMYNNEKVFANDIKNRDDSTQIIRELAIQANSKDEDLKDIARNTLGAKELLEGVKKEMVTDKADLYQTLKVNKNKLADTYQAVLTANEIFKGIDRVLGVISASVMMIAAVKGFRGINGFRGNSVPGSARSIASGNRHQIYTGPKGQMMGIDGRTSAQRYQSMYSGTWNKTRAVGRNMWSGAKNFIKGGGGAILGGMAIGAAGNLGAGLMDAQSERLREKGLHNDADNVNLGASALRYTANGAALGMIGGVWGAAIGGVLGGAYGAIKAGIENRRNREAREKEENINVLYKYIYDKTGVLLQGDYSEEELFNIRNGRPGIGGSLLRKMNEQDPGAYDRLPPESFGSGGLIRGNSHANGGTMILAEGNEFVVNAKSTQENLPLLNAINNNTIKPTQLMGNIMKVNSPNTIRHHVGFDNLNVNMDGDLQLSLNGGYSQTINTNELLSNPSFISGIRDEIIKQINYTTDKTFIKDNYYKKF